MFDLNRNYLSKEEMENVGLTRGELGFLVASSQVVKGKYKSRLDESQTYKDISDKLSNIVEARVYTAVARYRRGLEVLKELPNEGVLNTAKTLMLSYGLLTNGWMEKSHKHEYNPFCLSADKNYAELKPGKMEQLGIFLKAKIYNKSKFLENAIYRSLTEQNFLDSKRLTETEENLGYRDLLGLNSI